MTTIKTNSPSNQNPDYTQPVLQSVLHPSDFSAGSLTAFQHALKAALVAKSRLTILHLSPEVAAAWTEFSGVAETLERWGLLPPGSRKSALPQLGIEVRTFGCHRPQPREIPAGNGKKSRVPATSSTVLWMPPKRKLPTSS